MKEQGPDFNERYIASPPSLGKIQNFFEYRMKKRD
jgi:hypothetical protein